MPKLPPLRVAGTQNASFRPSIGRAAFGVEEGQKTVATAAEKVGQVMEGLAIERNQNEGTLAGIEAQKQSSIALFQAQQSDPVNYAANAKKILEETKLNSTKGFASSHAEKAFDARWNSFAASRMVNAYQVQEGAQKQQNIAVYEESMAQELENVHRVPNDAPAKSRQEEYLAEKMALQGIKEDDPRFEIARSQMNDQFYAAQISGYSSNGDTDKARELLDNSQGKGLDAKVRDSLDKVIRDKNVEMLTNKARATGQAMFNDPEALAAERERFRGMDNLEPGEQQALVNVLNGGASEQKATDAAVYSQQSTQLLNEFIAGEGKGNTAILTGFRTEREKMAAMSLYASAQNAKGGANSDDSPIALSGKDRVLRTLKDLDFADLGQDEDGNNVQPSGLAMQLIQEEEARIKKVNPSFSFSSNAIGDMIKEAQDKANGKDNRKSDAIAKKFYKSFFKIDEENFSPSDTSWAVWVETANRDNWASMLNESDRISAATTLSKTMKAQAVTDFGFVVDSDTQLKTVLDDGDKIDFDEGDRDEALIGGQNFTRDSIDAQIKSLDINQPITDRLRAFFLLKNMGLPKKSIELYLDNAYTGEE